MDTLTHIVLGACIGEAIAGKELGRKALVVGAIANSLPDIDFVASFWLPVSRDLLAHRGFTHSIAFMLLVSPLIAMLCSRLFKNENVSFARWYFFWGLQISVHLFIDCFNAYGTGLFEPFSHYRVSFNTLYVADPLYTIWLCIAAVALLITGSGKRTRKFWTMFGLGISTLYVLIAVFFKLYIDQAIQKEEVVQHARPGRYFSTPTPLNSMLWYIVAESDSGFNIGYSSVFDKTEHITFHYAPKNRLLLTSDVYKSDAAILTQFPDGFYTISNRHDTLVFNVLRFGEILGWANPNNGFVFYYNLQYPDANELIVQRGRFAGWNKENIDLFLKRIKGI